MDTSVLGSTSSFFMLPIELRDKWDDCNWLQLSIAALSFTDIRFIPGLHTLLLIAYMFGPKKYVHVYGWLGKGYLVRHLPPHNKNVYINIFGFCSSFELHEYYSKFFSFLFPSLHFNQTNQCDIIHLII